MIKERDEIVSSESEQLILVDDKDNMLGPLDKSSAHDNKGILHRAFSVFVFNSKHEVLLQKRTATKRLWPEFWSNSCCSHPRWGEEMDVAVTRRVSEELGVVADFEYLFKFIYQASYGDVGSEHELCSVFVGTYDGELIINKQEIAACLWVAADQLDAEIKAQPAQFTPWMKQEWQRICTDYPAWSGR